MLNGLFNWVVSAIPWITSEYFWIPLAAIVLVFIVHFVRYIIEGGLNYNG